MVKRTTVRLKGRARWLEQVEFDLKFGCKMLMDGKLRQQFVVHLANGASLAVATPEMTQEEAFGAVHLLCVAYDAVAFSMITGARIKVVP